MSRIILFFGLVLGTINTSASVLYFTRDMTERVYLKGSLFQPSSVPLEHSAAKVKSSRAAEQHRGKNLYLPSQSLLEELISQVAPIQIGAKFEAVKSGTKIALVVEEEVMDPFFNISFGEADTTNLTNMEVVGATNDAIFGVGARELLENQLKQNELARQIAIDLRSFYRETDFSSVDIKLGEYYNRFSLSHSGASATSQSIFRSIGPKKHNNKTVIEESSYERFTSFIPSFLFSRSFWLVSYLLICVTILARGMLKKHSRVAPPI